MRITEAAARLGMSPRMLRYREDLGLLPRLRDGLGPSHRQFSDEDIAAVAVALELERRLKVRRRQTALIAYATFALACIFLIAWVCEALSSPWTAARIALALKFLPFCALFFLLAFYHALLNFQIRIGRAASWREYLATSEPFWPR